MPTMTMEQQPIPLSSIYSSQPGMEGSSLSSDVSEITGSPAQLEALSNQLEKENRIKEGAENLLTMPLTEQLRMQVESELDMAKNKIESIRTVIEQFRKQNNASPTIPKRKFAGQAPSRTRPRGDEVTDERDDFPTALSNATACIKTLSNLGRNAASSPTASTHSSSSSTGPAHFNEQDVDRTRVLKMKELVVIFQRSLRVRYEIDISELVNAVLPCLSDRSSKQCRAGAYRVIRYGLINAEVVKRLEEHPLEWFIVKSLSRDNKFAVEKEQAIKLIRTIVEVGQYPKNASNAVGQKSVPLSEPVMRALIALAEHAEDPFRSICVQTLLEILLIDIDLVSRTGGIRFLLHTLGEGSVDATPILASAFLYIIDSPRTRSYLKLGRDLEIALSAVTDAYGKPPEHADRMRSCVRVIKLMLRTWSGLMYFCMDDMLAIRSIVNTLRIPSLETREIILDMFFEMFNIKAPEWYKTFIDGRRLTMYRKSRAIVPDVQGTPQETLKLTDQYIALLVLVFVKAGLVDALTEMLEEFTTGSNLSRKATLLMAEILQMANRVLPLSVAAKIQAIPRVFGLASDYSRGEHRIVGTRALSAIDSFNRNRARLQPAVQATIRPRANSTDDAVRRGQRQVEQARIKMGMQMDDKTFQASLIETQVMITKDFTKWNFDALQELIEGPLLNPKRMEEAIKGARFVRRLMAFFDPFSHRFSDIPRNKANLKWIKLGCQLLTTLLQCPDGVRYLSTEDLFLMHIVRGFAQLDPFNGTPDSDPIFSKKRVADTLTFGYFDMLGTLTKQKEGIELMEKFKVFTAFYHLSELRSREDLIKGIIENLDYTNDGHPRIILSKALTSSYKHIRIYATRHLGHLIGSSTTANAWTLRLLLTQLYDPAPEVCEMAIHFLEEACEDKDVLQLVVEMQPTMDHLGEVGHPLLLKFMSTPIGFRYLYEVGYIDREMDMWFHERNIYYVVQVEVFLAKVFNTNFSAEDQDILAFDGTVPSHFYGEVSKTELGCQVLQAKGHFAEFAHFIRLHGVESDDAEVTLKLKSILWAVGNVGATEGGLPFLEEEGIIQAVLRIAEYSPIPSLRGTCFFVLGLISSTSQGAEILDDYNWEATISPLGTPTGLCIPTDMDKFITLPPWDPVTESDEDSSRLLPPTVQTEIEVLGAIQNLANTVIANTASRSLARMKSRAEYRPVFSSTSVFYRALHIISTQRYRLPVRRYVLDLFDIEVDPEVAYSLSEYSKSLRAPVRLKPLATAPPQRVVSVFIRRPRSASESEDDEDVFDMIGAEKPVAEGPPALSLRPVSRTVGFRATS